MRILKFNIALFIMLITTLSVVGQSISWSERENREEISAVTESGFRLKLELNNMDISEVRSDYGSFHSINIKGFGKNIDYGNPQLPIYKRLMELPRGAQYEVRIIKQNKHIVDLAKYDVNTYLLPSQKPIPKVKDIEVKIEFNKETYRTNSYYQNELVKIIPLGTMRGVDLARIEISPIKYNPVTNQLEVLQDLDLEVIITGVEENKLRENKQKYQSPYYQSLDSRLINGGVYGINETKQGNATFSLKYVIVADSIFKQSLQPFVRWKEKKGFKVIEAYTQDPAVGNTLTSIRAYLKGLYNSATVSDPAPVYVLFVGDVAQLPSWPGRAPGTNAHVTDLYYCEFTGDEFPEMLYGRFSANDTLELKPQIQKTITYETYSMPDPSYLGTSVLIAGKDATYGVTHGDGQLNYGVSNYFNADNSTDCKAYFYSGGSYTRDAEIRSVINAGVSIANYTAHGSYKGWIDPAFNVEDVDKMTNKNKYSLMLGNACLTNKFDEDVCFGEALMRAKDKGAIGYIGASENTYWDEDYYWAVGYGNIGTSPTYNGTGPGLYDLIFHTHGEPYSDWAMSTAQYMVAGNMAVTQGGSASLEYWELYHVMGDPSLMPYLKVPEKITANYIPFIQHGWTKYTVYTVPFAQVAISQYERLISSAIADSNGLAELYFEKFALTGYLDLVITAQNYQPFFSTLFGGSPLGPYVVASRMLIDDSLTSSKGVADYGETVFLDMEFANLTGFNAMKAVAKIQSGDTQIVILDSVCNLGLVTAYDTLAYNDVFKIKVASNAQDQHTVNAEVVITDDRGDQWISPIYFPVYAPNIRILNSQVDDREGNNNGIIESGEKVRLKVLLKNIGSRDAIGLKGNLSSTNRLAVVGGNALVDTLAVDQSVWLEFPVQFGSQFRNGDYVNFIFDFVSQGYVGTKQFSYLIGRVDENFETGDFSKFVWTNANNRNWQIDTKYKYEGKFSARSSANTDNSDTSSLVVTMRVLQDDSISFYSKVSTESRFDELYFFIDNELKGKWSGDIDWKRQSYAVPAGYHTFRWAYIKDFYQVDLEDAVWVDYISFPPTDAWSSVECLHDALATEISLWPNPTTDKVFISLRLRESLNVSTAIYDQLGKKLQTEIDHGILLSGKHQLELDFSHLSSGVYFVQVIAGNQQYYHKLIVK